MAADSRAKDVRALLSQARAKGGQEEGGAHEGRGQGGSQPIYTGFN